MPHISQFGTFHQCYNQNTQKIPHTNLVRLNSTVIRGPPTPHNTYRIPILRLKQSTAKRTQTPSFSSKSTFFFPFLPHQLLQTVTSFEVPCGAGRGCMGSVSGLQIPCGAGKGCARTGGAEYESNVDECGGVERGAAPSSLSLSSLFWSLLSLNEEVVGCSRQPVLANAPPYLVLVLGAVVRESSASPSLCS